MTAQAAEKKTVKSKKEKALVIVESPAKSKTIKRFWAMVTRLKPVSVM